jgi:hypothetical protein
VKYLLKSSNQDQFFDLSIVILALCSQLSLLKAPSKLCIYNSLFIDSNTFNKTFTTSSHPPDKKDLVFQRTVSFITCRVFKKQKVQYSNSSIRVNEVKSIPGSHIPLKEKKVIFLFIFLNFYIFSKP